MLPEERRCGVPQGQNIRHSRALQLPARVHQSPPSLSLRGFHLQRVAAASSRARPRVGGGGNEAAQRAAAHEKKYLPACSAAQGHLSCDMINKHTENRPQP